MAGGEIAIRAAVADGRKRVPTYCYCAESCQVPARILAVFPRVNGSGDRGFLILVNNEVGCTAGANRIARVKLNSYIVATA